MCGICGIVSFGAPPDLELVKKMNGLIVHRGPDDEGYYRDERAALGMRRLSIIDLSTGHQPIANEDGTVQIVFNGEIYSYQALREELKAKGHVFKTNSDTETIVHAYEEEGPDCVKRLRGMFAFALWDKKRERLLLARDRVGKKPLLYTLQNGRLAFASELRCLAALPGVPLDLEPRSVDVFLSLQYIPSPRTIYKAIEKLPPAHYLLFEKGHVKVEKYWSLPSDGPLAVSEPEAERLLLDKLRESTRLRMISDVPLGAFLSGGIDSSTVVALMAQASERPVKTFSIGFEEAEFSELEYAREVARRYGTDHVELVVKPEMADVLPKLAWHYSEPYADASALPSYYVARETRRYVTVALNGDGGDEDFAGYLRYQAMKGAHYWDYLPKPLQKTLVAAANLLPERNAPVSFLWRLKRFANSAIFADYPTRHLKMVGYFFEDDKAGLYTDAFKSALAPHQAAALHYLAAAYDQAPDGDFVNRLLHVDFNTYLPECLMTKIDIATMANSLEGRSPFLDHEFVELAFRLPGHWKLKGLRGSKWILKRAVKDLLPPRIQRRGKMGFGIPLGPWFRGSLRKYWEDHVLSPEALKRGYFNEAALRRLQAEHLSGKRDHGYRMWALLMLELWHETFAPAVRIS